MTRNNIIRLLMVNVISIAAFLLLMLVLFKVSLPIGVAGLIGWALYVFYANYSLLLHTEDRFKIMQEYLTNIDKLDRKNLFRKERKQLHSQLQSLQSRNKIMKEDETDELVKDKYALICEKVENNLEIIEDFMQTYDFVTKPSPKTLHQLVGENDMMIGKFNELLDAMLSIDMSVNDVDMSDIDNLLSSIKTITK